MRKRIKTAINGSAMRWTLVLVAQASIFALAGVATFLLRFDFRLPQFTLNELGYAVSIWVAVKSIAFQLANLNRRGLRYLTITDVYRLLIANIYDLGTFNA